MISEPLTANNFDFDLPRLCRYFSERSPQPMLAMEGRSFVVRHANDAFVGLVGSGRSALIGHQFSEAVPEGDTNGCMSLLERVYRTGRPETLEEQRHSGVRNIYWSYSAWPIVGLDDRTVGVIVQVTDSTEIALFRTRSAAMNEALLLSAVRQDELAEEANALNARLQEVLREKEYFIAVLSHELRTPLTPVLLATSLLLRDEQFGPEVRENLQMIQRNVALEARLIDDLLDMTRLERGKLNVDRQPIELRDVVDRAIEVCLADPDAGPATLEVEACAGGLIVDGDSGRLQQVCSNLIRNAMKFTPAGGRVRVRCFSEEHWNGVEVSDTGIGIEPDFLPLVFSAFEQGDKTHTRRAGLGLGLAICKTIVELHGGVISAHSDGAGRGATFVVKLPSQVGARREQPYKVPAPTNPSAALRALRILLVEDHPDTARLMRRLLAAEGHTVGWAGDVASALHLADPVAGPTCGAVGSSAA